MCEFHTTLLQEFRKLLNNKLKLNTNKIKTPRRNSPYAFVCFRNDEDRENAIQVISNYKWKGNSLQAIVTLINDCVFCK